MALSFEEEVRAYLAHHAEHDPTLLGVERGDIDVEQMDIQTALNMLARIGATQTKLILMVAQEIDKLRAATDGG